MKKKSEEREKKSHADWTNLHILEQMNREEKKDETVSFQSTYKESKVKQLLDLIL